jgi:hypothetical protein
MVKRARKRQARSGSYSPISYKGKGREIESIVIKGQLLRISQKPEPVALLISGDRSGRGQHHESFIKITMRKPGLQEGKRVDLKAQGKT